MFPKKYFLLLIFILGKFFLQYQLIDDTYDLHRDEYLHLDQANHLAAGYISLPPFTSWIAFAIKILGNTEFWVKFFPILFGALTMVVVWQMVTELKGGVFAHILAMLALLFSAMLRINILFQPNSADIFFWTLGYYWLFKYLHSQKNLFLLFLGFTFGMAMLNKYSIVFWAFGVFFGLLIGGNRKIFANKYLYISAFIALLVFLPNLVWQIQHNFPVLWHMKTLAATQLVYVNRIDFLKDQVLFFFGALPILLFAFYAFFAYKPFQKYKVFFWAYLFTILIFLYFRAKSYYAIGLYPVLLAFGSVYIGEILANTKSIAKKTAYFILPTSIILLFIPLFTLVFPIYSPKKIAQNNSTLKSLGFLRWEDGKDHTLPQDFADMLSWKELAEKVDRQYAQIADKENTIVRCDNYGQAGAINFYSKFKNIRAVSYNADYLYWFPLEKPIRNMILVKEIEDEELDRKVEKQFFSSVVLADSISNSYAREFGTRIFVAKNAKVPINKILENDIAEEKQAIQ
jgi:hypothetical protein